MAAVQILSLKKEKNKQGEKPSVVKVGLFLCIAEQYTDQQDPREPDCIVDFDISV